MEESIIVKILIGGSPCTKWSCAQKNNRETEAEGIGWELFKNYLTAKEKFQPDFFLYENNKSAAPAIKDQIAKELGVGTDLNARFTYINSALVSAQNRQRFYVTNCGDIEQPKDRGILLKNILENGMVAKDKAYCLKHQAGNTRDHFKKHHTDIAFIPVCVAQRGRYTGENQGISQQLEARPDEKTNTLTTVLKDNLIAEQIPLSITTNNKSQCLRAFCHKDGIRNMVANSVDKRTCIAEPVKHGNPRYLLKNLKTESEKANTLTASCYKGIGSDGMITVAEPIVCRCRGRKDKGGVGYAKYECRGDGKSNALDMNVTNGSLIAEPCCTRYECSDKAKAVRKQYEVGKVNYGFNELRELHPCTGGGHGAKTGLYAMPIEFDGNSPTKAISNTDGKTYPVYCVKNGKITIKEKQYPIKLEDGYYIIRKLTVTEAARLQTMPDDYCRAVSATQAYKGLGNGWTAEVIIHLLQHMNIPLDEEIVVLSMYDGIGTGRYCLDKMGYKNVKYYATEIDKYAMQVSMSNYPDIIQLGDAFQVREDDWCLPNT